MDSPVLWACVKFVKSFAIRDSQYRLTLMRIFCLVHFTFGTPVGTLSVFVGTPSSFLAHSFVVIVSTFGTVGTFGSSVAVGTLRIGWLSGWLAEISADLREAVAHYRWCSTTMRYTNPRLLYIGTVFSTLASFLVSCSTSRGLWCTWHLVHRLVHYTSLVH